jgi:hypothetical protein
MYHRRIARPGVVPFAASSVPLRPIHHMGGFLGAGVPVLRT